MDAIPDQAATEPDAANRGRSVPSLVGIGASAGGIAALREFFAEIPARSGIAFVVVMHLAPDHESQLAEVLQRAARIPVLQVQGRTRIEPDHVYVIPPDRSMAVTDGHLELTALEERHGRRSAIDLFFRTVAEIHPDAVGVLLSGSGTDGVVGLKALKERGGVILAQSPEEAEYDTMPRAAVATGLVDFVLPVRALANKVVELRASGNAWPPPDATEPLAEEDAEALRGILIQLRRHTGNDLSGYKKSTILRRIGRRMQVTQTPGLPRYLSALRDDATEAQALLKDLLISVTRFFRDADAFQALASRVVPAIFDTRPPDAPEVRVWIPGCATGEEAYSVAMLLAEHSAKLQAPPPVQVFATDLDREAVAFAREGLYPDAVAGDVGDERVRRFFSREGAYLRVRRELRELVMFSPHNLLRDPPFSRLDLVSSRNLLIYLERELQDRVVQLFGYALRPGGFLFLGSSESIHDGGPFGAVEKQHRIYRRNPVGLGAQRLRPPPVSTDLSSVEHVWPRPVSRHQAAAERETHRRTLEAHAPPSILVGSDRNVVHVSESASRYLEFPAGTPTANLLRIVRPELRLDLRSGLFQALEKQAATHSSWIPVAIDGESRRVQLHVSPAAVADAVPYALVVFLESQARAEEGQPAPDASAVRKLESAEAELGMMQLRMQEMIESSEGRQEDLKASNEELQSINEEYKSTLEELETSKEELQSVNEELKTVNDELKVKVEELAHANDDLRNLMAATDLPTLFLDEQLRIKRFTPALCELFNVMPVDEGRPVDHVTHRLEYSGLRADSEEVLRSLRPIERELGDAAGRYWLLRITPYRTDENRIRGVVATFTDVSGLRSAQEDLARSEQRFRALVDATAEMVWTMDASGAAVEDSPTWRAFTGQSAEERRGRGWLSAIHPDDRAAAEAAWRSALDAEQLLDAEFRVLHASTGEWRVTAVRAVPVRNRDGSVREWVGMNTDITVRAQGEAALREAKEAAEHAASVRSQFLSTMSHELRTPLNAVIGLAELLDSEVAGPLQEPQKKMLGRIRECAWHLVAIIDEVLSFTRSTTGLEPVTLSRVDVARLGREIVSMMAMDAEKKQVEVRLIGAEQPMELITDVGKVRQIVTNVIGNAVKFTDTGEVVVELRPSTDGILFRVRDSGPGIAAEDHEKVFEPFVQLDGSTTRVKGGTGLGLAVSRRLARLLGGDERLESVFGKGSTFDIHIPELDAADPPP